MFLLLLAIALAWSGYKYAVKKGSLHPVRRGAISGGVLSALTLLPPLDEYQMSGNAEPLVGSVIIVTVTMVAIVACLGWIEERRKRTGQTLAT